MINREDLDVSHAEHDANPERFKSYSGDQGLEREYTEFHTHDHPSQQVETQNFQETGREEVEEAESVSSYDNESTRTGARQRGTMSRGASHLTQTSTKMEHDIMDYLDRHPTAVRRIQDHRLQHSMTVGSRKSAPGDLPKFGGGKPYPPPLPEQDEYVVEFEGHDDPRHAQNWPLRKKIIIASILIFDSVAATLASSIFSSATEAIGEYFGKGREVVTLGTSLFVLGYALGPIIFAPMSELYGRRLPIIIGAFAFGIFNIGVAVAKDYQTLMICRFFAGMMGSAPLTVVAAVFSDMFNNETRGIAVAAFSATVFNGPFCGPFIGGFITKSYLGWRWVAYIPAFMGFGACVAALFFQQESYGPVILVEKASELRRKTRNWGIHAKQEEIEVDVRELLSKNLSRPLRILFTEPIVLLITVYMSFIYGLLYLSLTSYSLIFGGVYGFSLGVSGLPYVGMITGVFIGFGVVIALNKRYVKQLQANNNVPVPEWRLPVSMVGGIFFSIGLFWLGWTGYTSSIPWIVPSLAGLALGFGIYTVFLQCLNYIIDAYLMFAASAIAANTIMRSLFGAVFPLFATYMFEGIGINWGLTLLGCVAALFIPMPFILYFFGKRIRAKSKFAPAPDIEQEKRAQDEESRGGGEGDEEKPQANGQSKEGAKGAKKDA
nr:putative transporter [Quercus suber]